MSPAFGVPPVAPAVPGTLATLVLVGHGWGPGFGMGQWGDFGYAVRYHFPYERVLDHFYEGTRSTTLEALGAPVNPTISVVILENLDLENNIGYDPVVTSASPFSLRSEAGPAGPPPSSSSTTSSTTTSSTTTSSTTTSSSITSSSTATTSAVGASSSTSTSTSTATSAPSARSAPAPPPVRIPAGSAVDLRLQQNGTWSAFEAGSCSSARAAAFAAKPIATGLVDPIVTPASAAASAPPGQLLTLCRHDGVDERLRGSIEAFDRQGYERTLNLVPLESYVAGVVPGEVSASWGADGTAVGAPQSEPWGFQALEAQAVAARSYALATAASGGWNGYADICDSTYCQAYVGAAYETEVSDLAVSDTAGEVRVSGPGAGSIVATTYSASTGGYTAPTSFPAVPDLGDACVDPAVPLECNPVHTWHADVPGRLLQRAYPRLGSVLAVSVTSRNRRGAFGGRALSVLIRGSAGALSVSGDAFARAVGLRSNWFAVARIRRAPATSGTTTTYPVTTTQPAGSTSTPPSPTSVPASSTSLPPSTTSPPAPATTSSSSTTTAAALASGS